MWCDMTTDGGGWTVFLSRQRQDTPVEFNQTWRAYADGFGTASNEYWLGMSPPPSNYLLSLFLLNTFVPYIISNLQKISL